MSELGAKYFKGRVIRGARVLHYVVWDGVRDYKNAPPLQALAGELVGVQLHLKVDEEAIEDIEHLIAAPIDCPEVSHLVIWTRDHRTYQLIVQRMSGPGCTQSH